MAAEINLGHKLIKSGDLGKVLTEADLLKDAVLSGDFMGIFTHTKGIADEFWVALHPLAPVPANVIEARFHLAKSEEPCVCSNKHELAAKIDEMKELAQAGDGRWLALFSKLLPIILALLGG